MFYFVLLLFPFLLTLSYNNRNNCEERGQTASENSVPGKVGKLFEGATTKLSNKS